MSNAATTTATKTFEVGNTYSARSACDHTAVWTWTVVKRSAKFLTLEASDGKNVRVGVKVSNGAEWALPMGSFSMAPVIRAENGLV